MKEDKKGLEIHWDNEEKKAEESGRIKEDKKGRGVQGDK
jgi:hypothetical protein